MMKGKKEVKKTTTTTTKTATKSTHLKNQPSNVPTTKATKNEPKEDPKSSTKHEKQPTGIKKEPVKKEPVKAQPATGHKSKPSESKLSSTLKSSHNQAESPSKKTSEKPKESQHRDSVHKSRPSFVEEPKEAEHKKTIDLENDDEDLNEADLNEDEVDSKQEETSSSDLLGKLQDENKELKDANKKYAKDLEELRKQLKVFGNQNNLLKKEMKKYSDKKDGNSTNLEKENERLMKKIEQLKDDINGKEKEKAELNTKIADLNLDLEVAQEEIEVSKLDKEYSELRLKDIENDFENLKKSHMELKAKINTGQVVEGDAQQSAAALSEKEKEEYENTIQDLLQRLQLYEASEDYGKDELAKKEQEVNELKEEINNMAEKDQEIIDLKEKLIVAEEEIKELNMKMDTLQEAGDQLEELVLKNTECEEEIEILKLENKEKDKKLAEMVEEINVFEELDELNKEDMRSKEEEIIKLSNEKELLIKEREKMNDNENLLIEKINSLKQSNALMKDELAKLELTNFDVDDVLNKNLTSEAKIRSLQRQKVLETLSDLEVRKFSFRNDIVQCMIPVKLFEDGNLHTFDKILSMQFLRKKVLCLIFSMYENELVNEDDFMIPPEDADPIDEVDAETQKKKIKFYYEVIIEYSEFFIILLYIEMYLSKLNSQELLSVTSQNYFASIQFNVRNCYQVIEQLIMQLREDTLTENYISILSEMKTSNGDLRKLLENFTVIGKTRDNLYEQINTVLPYFIHISYKFAINRIDIILKKEEAKNNLTINCTNLITGYKNLKKFLTNVDNEFFFNVPYEADNHIFDIKGSYYQALVKAKETAMKNEIKFEEYTSLLDASNQLLVISSSSLEKYLKNNEGELLRNKAKKCKNDNEDYLPLQSWLEITNELKTTLNSTVQIQEDLETTQAALKKEKLSNAELSSKLEEANRTKELFGQRLGQLEADVGKSNLIQRELEEAKMRNKKLDATIVNLASENDKYSRLEKQLNEKIEKLKKEISNKGASKKSIRGGGIMMSKIGSAVAMPNLSVLGEGAAMLNTINTLQKERKFLKSKFVKEKLYDLMEDNNSYMNKYILNDLKISKDFSEKDMYNNIKTEMKDLNQDFGKLRNKMAFPKVYDISKKNYSYHDEKEKELNLLREIKVNYYQNADKVFTEMFGDKAKGRTFKDVIDDDICQTLDYFGDNKIKVGKIRVGTKKEESKNQERTVVPILLTESSLSLLNSTFLH